MNVAVIGAGIFGITVSIKLANLGFDVILLEKNNDILAGASKINQNRIHHGFHYPRCSRTAKQCLDSLESFNRMYGNSIGKGFKNYYAISKQGSLTSVEGFEYFSKNLGLEIKRAMPPTNMLNKEMVKECWEVQEPIFDYYEIKKTAFKLLHKEKKILLLRNASVKKIILGNENKLLLSNGETLKANFVINATYSGLAELLPINDKIKGEQKLQIVSMPIMKMKNNIDPIGITIMDGPFCSLMPKGFQNNLFILSHVKESVFQTTMPSSPSEFSIISGIREFNIIEKSKKYFPILKDMDMVDIWITKKMVLNNSNDSRDSILLEHSESVFSMFSGKIATCVKVSEDLARKISEKAK